MVLEGLAAPVTDGSWGRVGHVNSGRGTRSEGLPPQPVLMRWRKRARVCRVLGLGCLSEPRESRPRGPSSAGGFRPERGSCKHQGAAGTASAPALGHAFPNQLRSCCHCPGPNPRLVPQGSQRSTCWPLAGAVGQPPASWRPRVSDHVVGWLGGRNGPQVSGCFYLCAVGQRGPVLEVDRAGGQVGRPRLGQTPGAPGQCWVLLLTQKFPQEVSPQSPAFIQPRPPEPHSPGT